MTDPDVASLVLDLLEWIGPDSRPYPKVMDAWRTSCPRLPVWETADRMGYLRRIADPAVGGRIAVSESGRLHLRDRRAAYGGASGVDVPMSNSSVAR